MKLNDFTKITQLFAQHMVLSKYHSEWMRWMGTETKLFLQKLLHKTKQIWYLGSWSKKLTNMKSYLKKATQLSYWSWLWLRKVGLKQVPNSVTVSHCLGHQRNTDNTINKKDQQKPKNDKSCSKSLKSVNAHLNYI